MPDKNSELMRKIAAKDATAFEEFYTLFQPRVLGMIAKYIKDQELKEELLQEIFITVWRKASLFNTQKGKVEHWLLTLSKHKIFDALRSFQRIEGRQEEFDPETFSNQEKSFNYQLKIRDAIQQLKPEDQKLIHAIYFQGQTQKEYSSQKGIALGTVKWKVHESLKKMRRFLGENFRKEAS